MSYDLFVIGAGPGGLAAAKRSVQHGAPLRSPSKLKQAVAALIVAAFPKS